MKPGSCRPEDVKSNIPLPFIRKFPFLTSLDKEPINCSQYRYLTIMTDGGINPLANRYRDTIRERMLFIEFDNGDVWEINKEIYNLNIERYGSLYLSNISGKIASPFMSVSGGYHNLYLMLTMTEYMQPEMQKENPFVSFSVEIENIAGSGTKDYWIGKDRFLTVHELAIPYIQPNYRKLQYGVSSTASNFSVQVTAYAVEHNTSLGVIINETADAIGEVNALTSRYSMSLVNNDLDTKKIFGINLEWLDL